MSPNSIIQLSEQLIKAIKFGNSSYDIVNNLKKVPITQLKSSLIGDKEKKVFWVNVYNAYYQIIKRLDAVDDSKVYATKIIQIAGLLLSLDDIEHGILRKNRSKHSLGYLPNFRLLYKFKKLAVSKVDFRIHFVLNCGAISCPPIYIISNDNFDDVLNKATLFFIQDETVIDNENNKIYTTRLFLWFIADFGGKKGVREILNDFLPINSSNSYQLIFNSYNWEEQLNNFA